MWRLDKENHVFGGVFWVGGRGRWHHWERDIDSYCVFLRL